MAELIVVDDEADITDMMELMLSLRGWTVKRALNRRVALQMIREDPEIHVVLLDYFMPDMRTDDFLEKIRQLHPRPKVILLTGAHRVAERARKLGIDHYIPKPFEPADVYDKVRQCLASQAS